MGSSSQDALALRYLGLIQRLGEELYPLQISGSQSTAISAERDPIAARQVSKRSRFRKYSFCQHQQLIEKSLKV
jgi:hypothetical protein